MKYCEVGNHEIAQGEDDHRCDHCNRPVCKAHMGNPDGLPGDLVACVDHVAEVRRKEAQLRLRRLRNQQEPTPSHDGQLKDSSNSDFDAIVWLVSQYTHIECVDHEVVLDAKQALSLLAWLRQEEEALKSLAKEQAE